MPRGDNGNKVNLSRLEFNGRHLPSLGVQGLMRIKGLDLNQTFT